MRVQVHQVFQLRKHISWMCRQAILQFCFLPSWWPRSSVKSPNGIRVSFLHSQSLITLHVQTYHVRLILLILRCLHLLRSSYGFRLDWKATPTGVHPDASPCFHLFLKKCSTMWTKTVVQGKLHCLYFPCFPPPWPIILKDLKLTEKEKKKPLIIPIIPLEAVWILIQNPIKTTDCI